MLVPLRPEAEQPSVLRRESESDATENCELSLNSCCCCRETAKNYISVALTLTGINE